MNDEVNQNKTSSLAMEFRPVASAESDRVDTFRGVPVFHAPGREDVHGNAILAHRGDFVQTARKNALVLDQAAQALVGQIDTAEPITLIVPVNAVVFASSEATSILGRSLKAMDVSARRAMTAELFNLPVSVTMSVLEDITIPMIAFIDRFIAVADPAMEDLTVFSNLNYVGMSLNLADAGDAESAMKLLWSRATPKRLELFYQGVDNDELLAQARRYKARGIEGDAVGPARDSLGA